ncbi:MAG: glycoside hydrolase family 127 protein, partial [Bacteroidota bacterium]
IYAVTDKSLMVNLFIGSKTTVDLGGKKVAVSMTTDYPWNGAISLTVDPLKKSRFAVQVRITGWVLGHPVPGETYRYLNYSGSRYTIKVNGQPAVFSVENGYAVVDREWKKGDKMEIDFPMEVRRVVARAEVKEDADRVALERGPLVYCFEHKDNGGRVMNMILPDNAPFTSSFEQDLLGGVQSIEAEVPVAAISDDGMEVHTIVKKVKAIPYYSWANRGQGEMQVWVPRRIAGVKLGTK